MNKLLMVTTVPSTLRSFLLPFAAHFRSQGWQVDAMACEVSASVECQQAFDRVWDVQWSRNPLDPRNLLGTPQVIREIVAREKYDIIHVHTPVAAFVTRYALKDLRQKLRSKVIYTAHGFHFYAGGNQLKNAIFIQLERWGGKWTDYLVTINHEDKYAAERYQLLDPERIRYMPGIGVDLNYYNPRSVAESAVVAVRQELGLGENDRLLLSVAEFTARKRHVDAIGAFAKLARSDVHLAFAGTGPLKEKMQQLASNLGVADRIHFLGNRRDIPVLMRAATANILVSAQEGLPRSVLESLALETPTIGTKIRGTQDLLADGCGLLVTVGDVDELASATTTVLDRPEEAAQMSKLGSERISTYDLDSIVRLHEQLYAEALGVVDSE
ncbi:glycosyltransferase [Chamaesiphon polymorphus]|uniref:Glycosyltransferase family 1 protein n=1 Tax=Chamaesiphon polymorphus CCALA 037 TaxID=2107692 RepID=A0A2T1GCY8_9CYAN|nr:glycosyltransferase [Chamaesiphon polymorphus]PSB55267.1 glycosyltransferase family 1 protein [Chamaesiphon polymorphus CCALA 037]